MSAVAITGLGVVAPNGLGTEEYWSAVLAGRSGIRRIDEYDGYPAALAGRITVFDARRQLPSRLLPQTDRSTRLAMVAAEWALADAGVDPAEAGEYGMGVASSNAAGGFEFTHREVRKLWREGPRQVSVYESFAWFYAANTGQLSIRHGARGPGVTLVGEQAGGLDALGHARRTVCRGTPVMLSGGVESALDPWGWVSHWASRRVSARGYLPFTEHADGYVPGEGGAVLVMESEQCAARRGADGYGTIVGHAATFDAGQAPSALSRAARLSLADAGLDAADVDVVFADAAGSAELDDAESTALRELFGPYGVPVTAPKVLVGRLYGGAGPLDVATALLALRDGVIPPTGPVRRPADRHGLDLVCGRPRIASLTVALVLARGRGGFHSALVLRGPRDG